MSPAARARIRKKSSGTIAGVHEFFLGNGLRVVHRQNMAAPAVAVCIVYHVGSRNEAVGHTGSTHILEHLLFKDSKNFNRKNDKEVAHYLEWFGAQWNATTWFDRTNYFELMPKAHVEEAFALEADRMRGSLFSDADLASEMTVVRNEYERGRNNPFELLDEEVWASAFLAHPYHHPTIGWKEDIEYATAERLREFYDCFYYPNNATLVLVGDLSLAEAKKLSEKYFAAIPRSPNPVPQVHVAEGQQEGARFFELKKPGAVSAIELAYKIPEGTHEDVPALSVLAQILAGGLSSRLEERLVDRGRAAEIGVSAHPSRDPGLIVLTAHAAEGVVPQKLLDEVRSECEKIAGAEPPSAAEVVRAKASLLAQYAFARDGMLLEAMVVTEALAAGDWRLAYEMPERMGRVSARDVARVAKKYLVREHETAGILFGAK